MIGILIIHFFALISPGPDFFYVVSNSLQRKKAVAIKAAFGTSLGVLFWLIISIFGITSIIAQYPNIKIIMSLLGIAYLLYLAYSSYKNRFSSLKPQAQKSYPILSGFLINATNPKALLYFLSIFSALISKNICFIYSIILISLIFIETLLWFLFVAYFFQNKKILSVYLRRKNVIDTIISVVFVLFALLVLVQLIYFQ